MDRLAQHRQQQQQQQGGYGGGGGRYDQGGYDNGGDYGRGGGYGQQGGYDQGGYDQGNYSQPDRYGGSGGGGGNYGSGGDYNPRRPNPYAQQDDRAQSYEMTSQQPYGGAGGHSSAGAAGGDDLTAFYDEIASIQDEIKRYNQNVATISDLQQRSLNNFDDNQSQNLQNQLEGLSNEQSQISSQLKRRIKELERTRGSGRDAQIKTQQTAFIKSKFVDAIQNYQQIEQQSRQRYKQRVERQYKIVNPQATQEEVRAVVNGDNNDQVFTQALMNSNRYGQSRDAYREVQARHADIKKIEKTLTELAQLFQDMSVAVEQQEETVNVIQNNAIAVHKDVEQGHVEMGKAVESARGARKKRWICFAIIVIIIIIVVIVLLIQFKPWQTGGGGGGGNNNNNNSSTSSNSTPTSTATP